MARTSMWPTMTAGTPASTAARGTARGRPRRSCSRVRVCTGSVEVAVLRHRAVAGEVLEHRHHRAASIALDGGDDVLGHQPRRPSPAEREPMVGSPGPDGDVGVRREDDVEAQPAQLGAAGRGRPPGQPRVVRRARGHEGREPGGVALDPLDDAALLVDGQEQRPAGVVRRGPGSALTRPDLTGRRDVVGERDDPAEVQAADHRDRGRGAAPLGDDHLAGEVGQPHPRRPAGAARLELVGVGPSPLDEAEPLGRRWAGSRRSAVGGRRPGPRAARSLGVACVQRGGDQPQREQATSRTRRIRPIRRHPRPADPRSGRSSG